MQHPFEGVMGSARAAIEPRVTRRKLMRRMFTAVAGLLGVAGAASAQTRDRRVTTQALGEEGGRVTTYALGEEGGRTTTYALGEEGGWRPRRRPTTYVVGEESGSVSPELPPLPPIPPVPPVPRVPTTLALGEEGGAGLYP